MMKVSKRILSNKLTLNYKKSCYMLTRKNPINDSNLSVLINQNLTEKYECVNIWVCILTINYLGKLI